MYSLGDLSSLEFTLSQEIFFHSMNLTASMDTWFSHHYRKDLVCLKTVGEVMDFKVLTTNFGALLMPPLSYYSKLPFNFQLVMC